MAPTASATKAPASARASRTWWDRTVTTVHPTPGSWPVAPAVSPVAAMTCIPLGHLVMSSRGSASACLALEAAPAVSARSSSGETPTWSAEPVTVTPGALRRRSVTSPRASVSAWRALKVPVVTSAPVGTRGCSPVARPATNASLSGTSSSLSSPTRPTDS